MAVEGCGAARSGRHAPRVDRPAPKARADVHKGVVFYNTWTKQRLVVVMPYRYADQMGQPAWILQAFEAELEVLVTEAALCREPYQRQGALIRGESLDDGEWKYRHRTVGGVSGED